MNRSAVLFIVGILGLPTLALPYEKCGSIAGRTTPEWLQIESEADTEPSYFIDQTWVRTITNDGLEPEVPITFVSVGSFVLSATYISDGQGGHLLVPCWDEVTEILKRPRADDEDLHSVYLDARSSDPSYLILSTSNQRFLVDKRGRQPSTSVKLASVRADQMAAYDQLVNLTDANRGFLIGEKTKSPGANYLQFSPDAAQNTYVWTSGLQSESQAKASLGMSEVKGFKINRFTQITTRYTSVLFITGVDGLMPLDYRHKSEDRDGCTRVLVHNARR